MTPTEEILEATKDFEMIFLLANLPEFDIMKVIFGGDYMHYKRVGIKGHKSRYP